MLELEAWLTKGEQRIVIEKDRVLRGIHKDIRVSQTPLPCSAIETQDYNLVFHKAMPEKGDVLVAHKPWWKGLAGKHRWVRVRVRVKARVQVRVRVRVRVWVRIRVGIRVRSG